MVQRVVNVCVKRTAVWASLRGMPAASFDVQLLTGGLSNVLYLAGAPQSAIDGGLIDKRDAHVVVREFGAADIVRDAAVERAIFAACSRAGVGPRLLGYSKSGALRVEEFVMGETLNFTHFGEAPVRQHMAAKLAKVHAMDVELPMQERGDPVWINRTARLFAGESIKAAADVLAGKGEVARAPAAVGEGDSDGGGAGGGDEDDSSVVAAAMQPQHLASTQRALADISSLIPDVRAEVEWLVGAIASLNQSPIAFCHNDAQEGNWIRRANGKLVLIDFEYGGYNPIAYDFGNIFCEHACDYQFAADTYPGWAIHPDKYPSHARQEEWFELYLEAAAHQAQKRRKYDRHDKEWRRGPDLERGQHRLGGKRARRGAGGVYETPRVGHSVDIGLAPSALAADARLCMLGSHLMWTLWSIVQARQSLIGGFGYMEYGAARAAEYVRHKRDVCDERGLAP